MPDCRSSSKPAQCSGSTGFANPRIPAQPDLQAPRPRSGAHLAARSGLGVAQLGSEPWRGTVDASLLLIDEIDHPRVRGVANVSTTMMTAEPMITRGAHYTALLDTIDHQGATKLHAREREQLLEAADALLFGEPDSERTVRSAQVLIDALETSERWSVESSDQVREHLSGCAASTGAS